MTDLEDIKSKEEIADDIKTEIEALGISINDRLSGILTALILILISVIIALIHFW